VGELTAKGFKEALWIDLNNVNIDCDFMNIWNFQLSNYVIQMSKLYCYKLYFNKAGFLKNPHFRLGSILNN
jgi:hypothetical protein